MNATRVIKNTEVNQVSSGRSCVRSGSNLIGFFLGVDTVKQYIQTETGKASRKRSDARYAKSPKGKSAHRRYTQTAKGKAALARYRKRYKQTAGYKASQKKSCTKYNNSFPLRIKAKRAVYRAVRDGKLPCVKTLTCSCGNQAKEYHHHKGYAKEHWLDVIPKCVKCHRGLGGGDTG